MNNDDMKRLSKAIIYYGALTGEGVGGNPDDPDILSLKDRPDLVQQLTSIMANIYRREVRETIFGWDFSD